MNKYEYLKTISKDSTIYEMAEALDELDCALCGYYSKECCKSPNNDNNKICLKGRLLWLKQDVFPCEI